MTGAYHANGGSVAAALAASVGLMVLALAQIATVLDESRKDTMISIGSWLPNEEGIGPYSGKETLMVVGWLGSWGLLHAALRHRELDVRTWFGAALAILALATLLLWPPVWHAIA